MDLAERDRLSELVEKLTTAGELQLNQGRMKDVKKLCRKSNDYVDHVYNCVMTQLDKEHAEIRLSAFQIASELFSRSHHFRTRLVDNFQEFLALTVETDSEQPLPPPKAVARKLKISAIKTVQSWHSSYGLAYKKLALGYHFLKQVKKVDFNDVQARTIAERRREEERQRRTEGMYRERVEAVATEMEESCQEIEATLTEMDSCLKLLLPDEFELSDLQTAVCSPEKWLQGKHGRPPLDTVEENQQPCCSKGLTVEGRFTAGREKILTKGTEKSLVEGNQEERQAETDEKAQKKGEALRMMPEQDESAEEGEEEAGSDERVDDLSKDSFIRNSGLISHSYSLNINLEPDVHVKETEDNEAVVTTLLDLYCLITTKHLPSVQSWIKVLTKSGLEQQLLRRALDLKNSLEAVLQKHKELHIDYKSRTRGMTPADGEDEEDDEEGDFEEVPEKEGFEAHIPEHLREEYGLEPTPSTSVVPSDKKTHIRKAAPTLTTSSSSASMARKMKRALEEEQDPTSAAATLRLLKRQLPLPSNPSTSFSSEEPTTSSGASLVYGNESSGPDRKASNAPTVPFGLDLYYWGQEQPSAGKIMKSASQHQFWVPREVEEEVENKELSAEIKSRYISFPGKFTPVSHTCNAPLGNGKLCPRQDRVKCPFHGVIVARDAKGQPTRPEDRSRKKQEERSQSEVQPAWRDLELMRDIEAATGEDLGSNRLYGKGKGKGRKKKKYPKLSDLNKSADTSRSRLEKKVFNKSSMRRVTEVMNQMDRRKHDKYSNQFNYALN